MMLLEDLLWNYLHLQPESIGFVPKWIAHKTSLQDRGHPCSTHASSSSPYIHMYDGQSMVYFGHPTIIRDSLPCVYTSLIIIIHPNYCNSII